MTLLIGLYVAAGLQGVIATLNLFLARMLGWRESLEQTPRLMREVFHVHSWFVSITVFLFALLTFRFAGTLAAPASNELARWLAAGIGGFWLVRSVIQIAYYSASHWRGRLLPTVLHIALAIVYSAMALTYLAAACR